MKLAFALAFAGCWTAEPRPAERAQDVVASGMVGVSAIRVDESHVYVLTDSMVARVDHDAGGLERLASGRELAGLALDATHVYWSSDEGLHVLAKVGGAVTRLAAIPEPVSSIAVAGDLVAVGTGAGVLRFRPRASDPPLMPVELDGAMPIVASGLGAIYAATRTSLHRIDRNGFAEQLLDSPGITALALDKHRGYLGEGATIRSFVRDGRTEPVADVAGVTTSIAVDARFIYWTATEPAGIYRQDKRTGSRIRFVNVREPGQLVIANGYLYWTEPAAGRVARRRL